MPEEQSRLSYLSSSPVRATVFCTLVLHFLLIPLALLSQESTSNTTDQQFLNQLASAADFKIAVLPMGNLTVEGDIAYHFRQRLTARLVQKGYTVVDNNLVDEKLYQLGVSHAGQLGLLPFAELQALTNADGFLSGIVEQGAVQHAGVYNSYVFTCSLKLQDPNGRVIWSALQNRVAKRRFAIDPVNMFVDIFLTETGGDQVEAVSALADQMLSQLPQGPVSVIEAGDPLLDQAVEISVKEE